MNFYLHVHDRDNEERTIPSDNLARSAKNVKDGPEFVGAVVANMTNGGIHGIRETGKAIARGIGSEHRTLQQMGIATLIQAIAHYHKEVGINGTDPRNEDAAKFSRAFYAWVKEGEGSELFPFPLI